MRRFGGWRRRRCRDAGPKPISRRGRPCQEDRAQLRDLARARRPLLRSPGYDGKIVAIQEASTTPPAWMPTGQHQRAGRMIGTSAASRACSAGGENVTRLEQDALSARAHGAGRVVALTGAHAWAELRRRRRRDRCRRARRRPAQFLSPDLALWRGVSCASWGRARPPGLRRCRPLSPAGREGHQRSPSKRAVPCA